MSNTHPIVPPAIPGFRNGRPNFEANPSVGIADRKGESGQPGLFDEVATQWGAVSDGMEKGRATLSGATIQLVPPNGQTVPYERHWNDTALHWLSEFCGVQEAAATRYGLPPLLTWAHDIIWHGFGILVPRWLDEEAGPNSRAELQPLVRSAVARFRVDATTGRVDAVEYRGQGTNVVYPYDDVIHVVWNGQPGELFGQGLLRSLVGPYFIYTGTLTATGRLQTSQEGILVMEEPEHSSPDDRNRAQEMGDQYDDGNLRWAIMPAGWKATLQAISSGATDQTGIWAWADAQADRMFSQRNSSLAHAVNGSRAVADTLGDEDHRAATKRLQILVADVVGGVLEWYARETGYTGTIYRAEIVTPDLSVDDTTQLMADLATAVGAGLIAWTPEDERSLRERIGWNVAKATTTVNAAPLADDAHNHGPSCTHLSCGSDVLQLSEPRYETVGRDGAVWKHRMPPVSIDLQGHTVYPERHVAWLADDDAEKDLERQAAFNISVIADEHRRDLAALDPTDAAAINRLRTEYTERYFGALVTEAQSWRDLGRNQAREEAADQATTPLTARSEYRIGAAVDAVETARRITVTRSLQTAAREIASRVEGEALSRPGLPSRITAAGLAGAATGALRGVEESSRILEAIRPSNGLEVMAFIRTSMLDNEVCEHCKQEHGTSFTFPEDEAAFLEYTRTYGPPDPSCFGGSQRCRCRFVPVYAKN